MKKTNPESASAPKESRDPRKKTAPTPKRKEQEARHFQGLVVRDKKAARQRMRAEQQRRFAREQEGLRTGQENLLPMMHQGAPRRFVRNFVDQRYSFAEWMILAVLVLMFGSLIAVSLINSRNEQLAADINMWTLILSYAALITGIFEAIIVANVAKKRAEKRFEHLPRGLTWYAFSRAVMPRRMRQPRAQVSRSLRKSKSAKPSS